MDTHQVLIKPIITEKATNLVKSQIYTFEVHPKANKFQVKGILEKLYKVKVDAVHILLRKGKKRKVGRKMVTKKLSDRKIAIVKLKEGKIDLFPQT